MVGRVVSLINVDRRMILTVESVSVSAWSNDWKFILCVILFSRRNTFFFNSFQTDLWTYIIFSVSWIIFFKRFVLFLFLESFFVDLFVNIYTNYSLLNYSSIVQPRRNGFRRRKSFLRMSKLWEDFFLPSPRWMKFMQQRGGRKFLVYR